MLTRELTGASILVTGGAGFVGSNLVQWLLTQQPESITVVDNLLSSERSNVPVDRRIRFIQGSVTSPDVLDQIADTHQFVFHLCTYHGNQSSICDPIADQEHNQSTTLRLFEHLKRFKQVRKIVYAAAGCAVARKTFQETEATAEDGPVHLEMDSPYSISKVVGEMYSVYYARQHGMPIVRARFQNVYGPGEILGAGAWRGTSATVWRNVVPTFVYRALRHESLPLEGGGHATRDFIFVADIVRGLAACALRGTAGDVYNLASGTETSIRDLADLINSLTRNPTPPLIVPGRGWDRSGRRFGSTAKAHAALQFEASVTLAEGLDRTISWTREHLPQIEACIGRHRDALSKYERAYQDAPA